MCQEWTAGQSKWDFPWVPVNSDNNKLLGSRNGISPGSQWILPTINCWAVEMGFPRGPMQWSVPTLYCRAVEMRLPRGPSEVCQQLSAGSRNVISPGPQWSLPTIKCRQSKCDFLGGPVKSANNKQTKKARQWKCEPLFQKGSYLPEVKAGARRQ